MTGFDPMREQYWRFPRTSHLKGEWIRTPPLTSLGGSLLRFLGIVLLVAAALSMLRSG